MAVVLPIFCLFVIRSLFLALTPAYLVHFLLQRKYVGGHGWMTVLISDLLLYYFV